MPAATKDEKYNAPDPTKALAVLCVVWDQLCAPAENRLRVSPRVLFFICFSLQYALSAVRLNAVGGIGPER
jgi:hypothetical protein